MKMMILLLWASKPCSEYTDWSGAAGGGLRLGAPPLDLLPDLSDHFDHGGAIMIAIEGRFQRMVLLMKLLELPGSLISFLVEAGQNTTLTMVLTFQIIDNLLLIIDDLLKLLEGLYVSDYDLLMVRLHPLLDFLKVLLRHALLDLLLLLLKK